jgi:omega-6 fatty acid desaturase (delta-12 desaturase)
MTMVAQLVGCLLFYVQHQYEDTYWSQGERWSYNSAALEGCSYLKLPRVLQWFTGNIGFHHIHHLNHKIPNYKLEQCYEEVGVFQNVATLTLKDFIACINMKIYDESTGKMLTWAQVRAKKKSLQFATAQ